MFDDADISLFDERKEWRFKNELGESQRGAAREGDSEACPRAEGNGSDRAQDRGEGWEVTSASLGEMMSACFESMRASIDALTKVMTAVLEETKAQSVTLAAILVAVKPKP